MRIRFVQLMLWLKTNLHPEALGTGDRRAKPRRRIDRRRERLVRAWGFGLTVLWIWLALTVRTDQRTINQNAYDSIRQRCDLTHVVIETAVHLGVPPESPDLQELRDLLGACRGLEVIAKSEID